MRKTQVLWCGLRIYCVRCIVAANDTNEEGYHTLGKLKCCGVAQGYILIYAVQQLTTVQQV